MVACLRGVKGIYAEHIDRPSLAGLPISVIGPVVAWEFMRINAAGTWRGLMGATDPNKAAPGTLRHNFGNLAGPVAENAVHGSDSVAAVEREPDLVFPVRAQGAAG
jgi:nucleoside-diphosphate kinase